MTEVVGNAHHLPGRLHLGAQNRINTRKFQERENRGLDEEVVYGQLISQTELLQLATRHQPDGQLGQGDTGGFAHEGHGAGGPRIDFQHVDHILLDGVLHIHQSDHLQLQRQPSGVVSHGLQVLGLDHIGRQHAGAVSGVNPGLLDMLHDAPDHHPPPVGHGVHVHLEGILQKLVDQNGTVLRHAHGFRDVSLQGMVIVHDHHGPSTENIGGPNQDGVADAFGDGGGLPERGGGAGRRLGDSHAGEQTAESLAVFRQVDGLGRGADNGDAGPLQGQGQRQRSLAAELHDHPLRLLPLHHVHDVFKGQRLEIEPIGSIVVGRDGLGIAVHHDRLEPVFLEGKGGMATAVVELDALPDSIGPAAQNHDLSSLGRFGLALLLVGGIEVGGEGLELGRAGVHPLVYRPELEILTALENLGGSRTRQPGQVLVGKSHPFGLPELRWGNLRQVGSPQPGGQLGDLPDLPQKPGIDPGVLIGFFHREAPLEGKTEIEEAVGIGKDQLLLDLVRIELLRPHLAPRLQGAQGLQQRLLEGSADGHDLPDRLHLGPQERLGLWKLLKGPLGDLGDHIVDGGFEACRGLQGDVVGNLVQRESHRQLGGDLGDGESGGLGGQGRAAGDPGIHFDHHQAPIPRIDGELDVGASGLHPHLANDPHGGIPHVLVFLVGEGLHRSHGDGIPRVDSHGIEVLNAADHHHVVLQVAHHLQFELLPTDDRLLDQNLMGRAEIQPPLGQFLELLGIVGNAASRAAQSKGGTDNGRVAHLPDDLPGLLEVVGYPATRRLQADFLHGFLEKQPIFPHFYRFDLSSDQLDSLPVQYPSLRQRHRQVESRLPAHGRQQGVGPLLQDDGLHELRRQGLDVGPVSQLRVGHDGGGVGIDQHHLVTLGLEDLAGLGP